MTSQQIAAALPEHEKDRIWVQALVDALWPHEFQFVKTAAAHAEAMARLRMPTRDQFWDPHYTGVSYPTVAWPVPESRGQRWVERHRQDPLLRRFATPA